MPGLHENNLIAILAFFVLAFSLYYFARKPLDNEGPVAPPPTGGEPDLRTEQ